MKLDLNNTTRNPGDYSAAVYEIRDGVAKHDKGQVYGLMVYGSVARGDFTPGRSDIDILMVTDSGVIINPEYLLNLGKLLSCVTRKRRVNIELNVYDRETLIDGRFLPMDPGFLSHMSKSGITLYGRDPIEIMHPLSWKHSTEDHVGFNLRGVRKGLVEACHYMAANPGLFQNSAFKTLERTRHLVRQFSDYKGNKRMSDSAMELATNGNFTPDEQNSFIFIDRVLREEWQDYIRNNHNLLGLQTKTTEFYQRMVGKLMELPRPSFG